MTKKVIKRVVAGFLVLILTMNLYVPVFAFDVEEHSDLSVNDIGFLNDSGENEGTTTPDGEIMHFAFTGKQRIPNIVGGAITPQKSSFKITISNIGIDTIDKITIKLSLYDDITGSFLSSYNKTLLKVTPGNTSFTWTKSKGSTVQERIELTGSAYDGGDYKTIKKASTVRWNFVGGRYGSISAYGGQRHHCPSKAVSPLSTSNGPIIRMLSGDHRKTESYGNDPSAKSFREKEKKQIAAGKFLAAQKLGINNINSLFGSTKYSVAIAEMVSYTTGLGYKK